MSIFCFDNTPYSISTLYYNGMIIPKIYYGSLLAYQAGGEPPVPPIPSNLLMMDCFKDGNGYWVSINQNYIEFEVEEYCLNIYNTYFLNSYNYINDSYNISLVREMKNNNERFLWEYAYWNNSYEYINFNVPERDYNYTEKEWLYNAYNFIEDETNLSILNNMLNDNENYNWNYVYWNNHTSSSLLAPCLFSYEGGVEIINSLDELYYDDYISNYAIYELAKNKNYSIKAYCPYNENYLDSYSYNYPENIEDPYTNFIYIPAYIYSNFNNKIYFNTSTYSNSFYDQNSYINYSYSIGNTLKRSENYNFNVPSLDYTTDISELFRENSYMGRRVNSIPNYILENRNYFENVINISNAFTNTNLSGDPFYTPKVKNMAFAYCYTYVNNAYFPDGVENIVGAYQSTLVDQAFCPNYIEDFSYTFFGTNIINPVCGLNVISMNSTYGSCRFIENPVCGPKVKYMNGTYQSCDNIINNVVCGNNVIDMSNTYNYCYYLRYPVCGPNVISMNYTYHYCMENLTDAVCGDNVLYMVGTYENCYNLKIPYVGPNVVNMANSFLGCNNIDYCIFGKNVEDASFAYENATFNYIYNNNLLYNNYSILNMDNIKYMVNTFRGCSKGPIDDTEGYLPPNLINAQNCYSNSGIEYLTVLGNSEQRIDNCQSLFSNGRLITGMYHISDSDNTKIWERFPIVNDLSEAFYNCRVLEYGYTFGINCDYIFYNCPNFVEGIVMPYSESLRYAFSNTGGNIYVLIDDISNYDRDDNFYGMFERPNHNINIFIYPNDSENSFNNLLYTNYKEVFGRSSWHDWNQWGDTKMYLDEPNNRYYTQWNNGRNSQSGYFIINVFYNLNSDIVNNLY